MEWISAIAALLSRDLEGARLHRGPPFAPLLREWGFPDPPVSRADPPQGVQGDIIVEVTINSAGNLIATKLLHGIGYGIEQKVLEVLPHWRFHLAVRDGVTIASQQLLYFHYPS